MFIESEKTLMLGKIEGRRRRQPRLRRLDGITKIKLDSFFNNFEMYMTFIQLPFIHALGLPVCLFVNHKCSRQARFINTLHYQGPLDPAPILNSLLDDYDSYPDS